MRVGVGFIFNKMYVRSCGHLAFESDNLDSLNFLSLCFNEQILSISSKTPARPTIP